MFWNALQELLKERGWTASQLASQLNIPQSNLTAWRNGRTPLPKTLIKLADFFNVSVDYLLGRTTNREPYRS